MRMKEFKDFTELTYSEISKALGLPQSRCEKLYRGVITHKISDIEAIRNYMMNRGKNIINVDFTPKTTLSSRKYMGEVDLSEYRSHKRKEERKKVNRTVQKSSKPCRGFGLLDQY